MHLYANLARRRYTGYVVSAIVFIALVFGVWSMLGQTQNRSSEEQVTLLRNTLRRAAVSCYAIESRYPPNLDYIIKNYGVVVNEEKYLITYNAFAENIMPTIRVLEVGKELSDE